MPSKQSDFLKAIEELTKQFAITIQKAMGDDHPLAEPVETAVMLFVSEYDYAVLEKALPTFKHEFDNGGSVLAVSDDDGTFVQISVKEAEEE